MQRKLHPLEGIVAVFALFFVLAITIGFAQAQEAKAQKAVYLRSSSALVLDADTGEIVIDKNADTVTPIASITKLMTAMVVLDRNLDLDQRIVLSRDDIDSLKGTRSRLRPGNVLTRRELLLLALMASENLAAAALGRVKLVRAAHEYPLIREFSTRDRATVKVADRGRPLTFQNTNGLVRAHH